MLLLRRLKFYGWYYLVIGLLSTVSLIFFQLWRVSILGLVLLAIHYLYARRLRPIEPVDSKKGWLWILDVAAYGFPFALLVFIFAYHYRSFNHGVVLPQGYEGIVEVLYDDPNGVEPQKVAGWLGLGTEYLIMADENGIARTRLAYPNNALPFMGVTQRNDTRNGLAIYYSDDLRQPVIERIDADFMNYEGATPGDPNLYFVTAGGYPRSIFVLIPETRYCEFFESEALPEASSALPPDSTAVLSGKCVRPLFNTLLPKYRRQLGLP